MRTQILLAVVLATAPLSLARSPDGPLQGPVEVIRVVDGDTVRLNVNGVEENVRLIGIDTPETVHPQRDVEPYGPEASTFTKRLLEGHSVWVELDVQERDNYRRPLAYLYLENANGDWEYNGRTYLQANLEIARAGYADQLTISPNVRYANLYRDAVAAARAGGHGKWEAAPPPPTAAAVPIRQSSAAPSLRYEPRGPDRNCGDFRTHAEAQAFFIAAGGPQRDPHRLDGNNDGRACESLP